MYKKAECKLTYKPDSKPHSPDYPSPVDATAWHLYSGPPGIYVMYYPVSRPEEAGGKKRVTQGFMSTLSGLGALD